MSDDVEFTVREVPHVVQTPDWLVEKAAKERAELERLLTPKALTRLDALVAETDRRALLGGYEFRPAAPNGEFRLLSIGVHSIPPNGDEG